MQTRAFRRVTTRRMTPKRREEKGHKMRLVAKLWPSASMVPSVSTDAAVNQNGGNLQLLRSFARRIAWKFRNAAMRVSVSDYQPATSTATPTRYPTNTLQTIICFARSDDAGAVPAGANVHFCPHIAAGSGTRAQNRDEGKERIRPDRRAGKFDVRGLKKVGGANGLKRSPGSSRGWVWRTMEGVNLQLRSKFADIKIIGYFPRLFVLFRIFRLSLPNLPTDPSSLCLSLALCSECGFPWSSVVFATTS